jgi:hypothetical protein
LAKFDYPIISDILQAFFTNGRISNLISEKENAMKNLRSIVIALVIFAFVAVACGTTPVVPPTQVPPTAVPPTAVPATVQPTYTPLPTNTPYPTQVPPTAVPPTAVPATAAPQVNSSNVVSAFLAYGLVLDNSFSACSTPCTHYWNNDHMILGSVYDNGMVVITFPVNDDSTAVGTIVGEVLTQIYGSNVTNWVGNNIPNTKNGDQTTTIDGYSIFMRLTPADSSSNTPPLISVVITATGSGSSE